MRLVAGTALVVAPGRVIAVVPHGRVDGVVRGFARLLGARDLLEAAVLWRRPGRFPVLVGATVDAVHAASMVALAMRSPDQRRLATTAALAATLLAAVGMATAGRLPEDG